MASNYVSSIQANFDKSSTGKKQIDSMDVAEKSEDKNSFHCKNSTGDMFSNSIHKNDSALSDKHVKKASPLVSRQQPLESSLNSAEMAPKLPPKPIREQARVLYPYESQNDDELTIKEGDIITIISKENDDAGWWKGELNGRIALFPDNFVEIIKQSAPPPVPPIDSEKPRVKKPDRSSGTSVSSPPPTQTSASSELFHPPESSLVSAGVNLFSKKSKFSSTQKQFENSPSQSITNGNAKSESVEDKSTSSEDKSTNNDEISQVFSSYNSASKLVHLTSQRPKIPSSARRPPSLYISKDSDVEMDIAEESNTPPSDTESSTLRPTSRVDVQVNSSPEKMAPWVMELKIAQEKQRRKENEKSEKNSQPEQSPTTTTATIQKVPSLNKSAAPNPPSAKPIVSKSRKPILTQHSNDETQSVALKATQPKPTVVPKSVSATNHVTTVTNTTMATNNSSNAGQQAYSATGYKLARDEEFIKLKGEVTELRTTVNELHKDLEKQSKISQGYEKQIQELRALLESQKKYLPSVVKELINELAEEKKKIATLQIELDRLNKLNTTV